MPASGEHGRQVPAEERRDEGQDEDEGGEFEPRRKYRWHNTKDKRLARTLLPSERPFFVRPFD